VITEFGKTQLLSLTAPSHHFSGTFANDCGPISRPASWQDEPQNRSWCDAGIAARECLPAVGRERRFTFRPPPGCPATVSITADVSDLSSVRWEDMSAADKSRYLQWCRVNDEACKRSTAIWYVEKCTSEIFSSLRAQYQCPSEPPRN